MPPATPATPLGERACGPAADPATWRRLRDRRDGLPQVEALLRLADVLAGEPVAALPASSYLEFERTGDRAGFERRYFQRRRRLAALALAALLEPERDTRALAETVVAICDEPQWALPAHVDRRGEIPPEHVVDLFAAETASALAEITGLLGPRLPDAVVRRARTLVRARVIDPYESHRWWWEDSPTNWASVCAGSVALAVLQVCEPDHAAALAPRLRATLRRSLDGYGDDGVCVEGFGYWTYGFGYHLVASEALDAALGPDPVAAPGHAAEAARWPSRAFLGGRVVVPFADTHVTDAISEGLLALAARRYGGVARPAPEVVARDVVDECGRWALALHGLARLDGAEHVWDAAPRHPLWFPRAQWLVVPQGERSPVGLAARAGHNGEPHNHNDLGSFALAVDGELLVGDAGRGVYDREYFGPRRYDSPATGSHGHPVPLLDEVRQAEGEQARAEVLEVALDGGRERLVLDLTAAYPHPALVRLVRTIERDGAVVTVTDAVETSAPVRVRQRFPVLAEPGASAAGTVEVAGARGRVTLRHDPGAAVETGAFPTGRGGFPQRVWWVDVVATTAPPDPLVLTTVLTAAARPR